MKPHTFHAPGLPVATTAFIDSTARAWRARIDKELAARGKERAK